MIYLIGALRNPKIPYIAQQLRQEGHDVFDDWYAVGPECDTYWREYEQSRGLTFAEALRAPHATDVFNFDHSHLKKAHCAVLVAPAGKSGHLELGWMIGKGKPSYVLLESPNPERWDIMYRFATKVCCSVEELLKVL